MTKQHMEKKISNCNDATSVADRVALPPSFASAFLASVQRNAEFNLWNG